LAFRFDEQRECFVNCFLLPEERPESVLALQLELLPEAAMVPVTALARVAAMKLAVELASAKPSKAGSWVLRQARIALSEEKTEQPEEPGGWRGSTRAASSIQEDCRVSDAERLCSTAEEKASQAL
jgi:hypothetical protein